jgi:energy-coupling factor transport system permease protein
MQPSFHPYTWTLWLVAGMSMVLLTRNPLYLLILLVAAGLLYAVLLQEAAQHGNSAASQQPLAWRVIVRLALFLWGFTILFNALTVHVGPHILFTLPRWPVIGGPITLEALVYGFVTGLNFVSLILLFAIYNSVLGPHDILRMIPGFAYQTGVAISIAISFVPQTVVAWSEIREAQRLRGHRVKGWRDTLPLFISLLSHGLDRAIQLAESMDARGFGGRILPANPRQMWLVRSSALLGLLLMLAGLISKSWHTAVPWLGLSLMAAGATLMLLSLWQGGARVQRSRYRRWLWRPQDWALLLSSGLMLLTTTIIHWRWPHWLYYYPYPPHNLIPDFNALLGLLFILPLMPALLRKGS